VATGWYTSSRWLCLLGVVSAVALCVWFWVRSRRIPITKSLPKIDDYDTEDIPAEITDDPDQLIDVMLRQERYALLLRPQIAGNLSPTQLAKARAALEEDMALVPEGEVFLCQPDEVEEEDRVMQHSGRMVRVEAALLDRYPVTNRQYKRFVDAGGYREMALWDEEIWPGVFDFVDASGHAGPRWWNNGSYARGEEEHPVVGVSWYEACAYARWVGKRLATDAEWVKAGCWPMPAGRGLPSQRRFPWGDVWEPERANTWAAGLGRTCPVTNFEDGASVAGVYGLIGNVWEWTADPFGLWHNWSTAGADGDGMRSLRGGAFDTYFESQATCQFQSGDSPLARKHNIGFRCALGMCDLRGGHDSSAGERELELEEV
jgi:iron(II)-dependent oxidoreductase